jgi:hypothetical protein
MTTDYIGEEYNYLDDECQKKLKLDLVDRLHVPKVHRISRWVITSCYISCLVLVTQNTLLKTHCSIVESLEDLIYGYKGFFFGKIISQI